MDTCIHATDIPCLHECVCNHSRWMQFLHAMAMCMCMPYFACAHVSMRHGLQQECVVEVSAYFLRVFTQQARNHEKKVYLMYNVRVWHPKMALSNHVHLNTCMISYARRPFSAYVDTSRQHAHTQPRHVHTCARTHARGSKHVCRYACTHATPKHINCSLIRSCMYACMLACMYMSCRPQTYVKP
jgi:hypothetical protein